MNSLLPPASSSLEKKLAESCSALGDINLPLRELNDPKRCPATLLPYLAWAMSVDRWDPLWQEATRRNVISNAFFVHQHKGTISALRQVIEPLGLLIKVEEWWQTGATPGTFRLEVGVKETGITEDMYLEMERLIDDARPVSRQLQQLSISLGGKGQIYDGVGYYDADTLTVYPYLSQQIDTALTLYPAPCCYQYETVTIYPQTQADLSLMPSYSQGIAGSLSDDLPV